MLWIPVTAAGIINGIGHYWGYRNYDCNDAATNIVPFGLLIGGEELHNNHHTFATSAKLSSKWYEFDIGWGYIRILEMLGLAQVKKVAPKVRFDAAKTECDQETLQAIITHRYDVLAKFAKSLRSTCTDEIQRLAGRVSLPTFQSTLGLRAIKRWLHLDAEHLPEHQRATLNEVLRLSKVLDTVYSMRQELTALWGRSNKTRAELLKQLQDWCRRAEESGIAPLQEFYASCVAMREGKSTSARAR